jgi:hypothetical protein
MGVNKAGEGRRALGKGGALSKEVARCQTGIVAKREGTANARCHRQERPIRPDLFPPTWLSRLLPAT